MKRKPIVSCIIVLFCIGAVWAKAPAVNLQRSSNGYTLEYELPDFQIRQVDTLGLARYQADYGAEVFSRISIPRYGITEEVGKPELPFLFFYMAISDITKVPTFEVVNKVEEAIALPYRLLPRQEPWYKYQTAADRFLSIDKEYYASRGTRAPIAVVNETFTIRGIPCAMVYINPFAYNPAENKLTVIRKLTLKVNTPVVKIPGLDSKTFESFLRYVLVNFDAAVEPVKGRSRNDGYHIITAPSFESGLSTFVSFRQNRFNVQMVTTSTSGTSASAIQSYLKGLSPTPTYLLLVGDVDDIPGSPGGSNLTALYYGSLDGNTTPEIFVGRFSVTSSTELSNIVDKTIYMEQNLGKIAKRNSFLAGEDSNYWDVAEGSHNYVIDNYLDDYENIKFYCHNNTISESDFTAALNEGVIFNYYSAHGSNTSWGAGDFSLSGSDMKALTNETHYAFQAGFCCLCGTYSTSECFTEAAIRGKGGSVTSIGATISTTWTPDDNIERGIFDAIFDDNNPQTSVGASLAAGKLSNSSSQKTYCEVYNIMGDAAVEQLPINLDPFIAVGKPNGGEQWEQGTTQEIRWGDNIDGNVKIELFKGGSLKEELAASTESDGSFEWQIAGDYETGDDYKVKITSVDSTALNDESDENFSITAEFIVKCPYFQNFDTLQTETTDLPKKWEQLKDDIDWLVLSGPTPSKVGSDPDKTGPDGDHTTTDANYIYIEASGDNNPDKEADFITCKFDFKHLTNPVLTFYYHMFSADNTMGDLYLDINVDGTWKNDVVHLSGNNGDEWKEQTVDLNDHKGDRVIFRFRGITGSDWASDICIDDFEIDGGIPIITSRPVYPTSFGLQYYGSRIHYQVPKNINKSRVTIALYNLQGKLVQTLVNNNVETGYHSVQLPNLANGLYLCKMKAGEFVKSVNVILTK